MRWPRWSIRTTVLASIVVGVVLPALLALALDGYFARRAQEPVVERNRAAVVVLANAVIAEPAWTMSPPALRAAVRRLLDEPTVCAVEVLGLPPMATPVPLRQDECLQTNKVVVHESPLQHEGQTIARLLLTFDDSEVDRLLAERRGITGWLVAAQVLFGVAVLAGVISLRLLRPIAALKRQAGRLAAEDPSPPPAWPHDDELGQLGQHLNSVHGQVRSLIDELEGKNAELQRMAMHDHLTGLPNRSLMRELFAHEAANARREDRPLALLFVDLDHFKSVNDTHGHAAGDEFLVTVARRLREALRESDLVCRTGGDEFLVLLPRIESREQAAATAARLTQAVRQPVPLDGGAAPLRIGASIGIAMYPGDGTGFDELVHAADVAMYRSKHLGRGRYSLYEAEMDTALRSRLELERELGEAVAQGQLRLLVQPMVDARDGRVVGAEALVRWQHPRLGLLTPDTFIRTAEATGAILPLGAWVMDAACALLASWQARGRVLHLAVNVSALQLHEPDFAGQVERALRHHGVAPGSLVLELTESTLLADSEVVLRAVAALREAEVKFAIDDFGTGYSSLSALKLVRPEQLKIDRSFVRDLPGSASDRALAEAIFGMAGALGIAVVAEGVETEAQRDWLIERGGWLQQGYLWSRPVPAVEFETLLTEQV